MNEPHAILLMAYGGPDSLEEVAPYLLDVRGGRPTSPELVEEIRRRYAAIGGKSPLLEITRRQAAALEAALNQAVNGDYRVFVGMRHWKPYIREAVDEIAQADITRVTTVVMSPFGSPVSTAAYGEHLRKAVEVQDAAWRMQLELRTVEAWYRQPAFVRVLAQTVRERLDAARPAVVVFTAHSLPADPVERSGDPYPRQYAELCELVARAAGLDVGGWRACYQSVGAGGLRWLGPSLDETLRELAGVGVKNVLLAPLGFLCDHVETLYELDIEAREAATRLGLTLTRTAALNDHPDFIAALRDTLLDDEAAG